MKTLATTFTASLTRLSAAVLIMATSACSGVAGNDAAADSKPERAPVLAPLPAPKPAAAATPVAGKLMAQIKAEIGGAACDNNQQCRSLPVGQRACGGPEAYLPYSTKVSDEAKLQRLAAQQSAEQREQNTRSGMMSTCQAIMDPGATCSAGKCVSAKKDHLPLPTQ